MIELPAKELEFLSCFLEPEPISQDQQRFNDHSEEEENKKREHEARMTQKKLEEEKAR